jgi:hypothetical protein
VTCCGEIALGKVDTVIQENPKEQRVIYTVSLTWVCLTCGREEVENRVVKEITHKVVTTY